MTEAAGKLTSIVSDLQNKMEKLEEAEKLSPAVGHPCLPGLHPAQHSPCSPFYNGSPRFHGFASNVLTSTATNDDLLAYIRSNDANAGPDVIKGHFAPETRQLCSEMLPRPPPGAHVHHVYVDDSRCPGTDVGGQEGGYYFSSDSSGDEIEIEERRRTKTTVTVGKKRSAKGGKPPSKKGRN